MYFLKKVLREDNFNNSFLRNCAASKNGGISAFPTKSTFKRCRSQNLRFNENVLGGNPNVSSKLHHHRVRFKTGQQRKVC